jgi:hypothetical protein
MMTKLTLVFALAIAAISAVPAFAAPKEGQALDRCLEDLGYGRVGTYGCG